MNREELLNYLNEDFSSQYGRAAHYLKHVAETFDQFYKSFTPDENNFVDALFPPMDIEEYEQEANELAKEKAGLSDDSNSKVFGFEIKSDNDKHRKLCKIRKNSKFLKNSAFKDKIIGRYSDVVFYDIVPGYKEPVIISFYIAPLHKIKALKKNYIAELPENKDYKFNSYDQESKSIPNTDYSMNKEYFDILKTIDDDSEINHYQLKI